MAAGLAHLEPGRAPPRKPGPNRRRAVGQARGAAAGLPDAAVTPPLPRTPCGCGRCSSPGGVRDVPDEQGGVRGPSVARHVRFLRSLRACPHPPGSRRLLPRPPQLRRPPARPPPLGLGPGPASAQPQRRALGGAERREPVRADRGGGARGREDPRRGGAGGPGPRGRGVGGTGYWDPRGPKEGAVRESRVRGDAGGGVAGGPDLGEGEGASEKEAA